MNKEKQNKRITNKMLNKVLLSSDVALVCVQHALSTEKEEIMGLLIGEVQLKLSQALFSKYITLLRIKFNVA